jgi:PhnB protein
MTLSTTTHLNFRGVARQALEFYQSVFGGEVTIATYGDFGMPEGVPGADKVVFGNLVAADGLRLMAYDIPGQDEADSAATAGSTRREGGVTITDRPFFQALDGGSLDEVAGSWERLVDGATIIEPLAASAWSAGFGMLTDRFGVTWTLSVTAQ